MRVVLGIPLGLLIPGPYSLVMAIPRNGRGGVRVGSVPFEREARHEERPTPTLNAVLILRGRRDAARWQGEAWGRP
jgi:hypothetical protein